MVAVRLAKSDWGKAWRAMIEIGPIRLIAADPIYEVLPAHLGLLTSHGFKYEIMPPRTQRTGKRRHGKTD